MIQDNEPIFPEEVGRVKCYWFNDKGIPRITIGPTWMFAFIILGMNGLISYAIIAGMMMLDSTEI